MAADDFGHEMELDAKLLELSDSQTDYFAEWIESGRGSFQAHILDGGGDMVQKPESTNKCACGRYLEDVTFPCFIYNVKSHKVLTLGECCYDRFTKVKPESNVCADCHRPHRNRIGNRCNECRGPRIGFGKYKGKYGYEVLADNADYLWWMGGVTTDDNLKVWIENVQTQHQAKESIDPTVGFGKYKGATMSQLMVDDPPYLLWFRDNVERAPAHVAWIERNLETIRINADDPKFKKSPSRGRGGRGRGGY